MGDMVIAIIFEETEDPIRLGEIIDRAQKLAVDVPDVTVKLTKGDAASTIRFFAENGELPTENILPDGALGTQKFKKRPLEIEAVQVRWANWNDVCDFLKEHGAENVRGYEIGAEDASDTCGEIGPDYVALDVMTTHGEVAVVRHGDWIIPDSKHGTFYPCKPDVFAATYSTASS